MGPDDTQLFSHFEREATFTRPKTVAAFSLSFAKLDGTTLVLRLA